MTSKERRLVTALAAGMDVDEAAEAAGYNRAYALRKSQEPSIMAAVTAMRDRMSSGDSSPEADWNDEDVDVARELSRIIGDNLADPGVRVSALRVLIAYRREASARDLPPVIIIDDIPDEGECDGG